MSTKTTKRGNGRQTQTLYLCSDGVYRSLGPAMRAWRKRP
jgi:hypothetical protein